MSQDSLVQAIKALQAAGNTGLVVLIVALILVVGAGSWLIWVQQQAMKRFETIAKGIDAQMKAADAIRQESRAAIEAQMKAADTIREESRKAQEIGHTELLDRFNVVQGELKRLESKQEGLKESVKNAISMGLEDIRERLTSIKVSDLIEQIPSKFRKDLEGEITGTSDRIMQELTTRLRQLPNDFLSRDENLREQISKILKEAIHSGFRQQNVFLGALGEYPQRIIGDYVAYRICRRLGWMRPAQYYAYPHVDMEELATQMGRSGEAIGDFADYVARRIDEWHGHF